MAVIDKLYFDLMEIHVKNLPQKCILIMSFKVRNFLFSFFFFLHWYFTHREGETFPRSNHSIGKSDVSIEIRFYKTSFLFSIICLDLNILHYYIYITLQLVYILGNKNRSSSVLYSWTLSIILNLINSLLCLIILYSLFESREICAKPPILALGFLFE